MAVSARVATGTICVLLVLAVFAPLATSLLGLPGPNVRDTSALSADFGTPTGPSTAHPLGVDGLGRDVLSRTIHGARVAVLVAIPAALLTMLIGVPLGMIAGLRGGIAGNVISRMAEVFLIIPYLVLAAGIASSCSIGDGCVGGALRPGIPLVVVVVVAAGWPVVTWLVRNRVATIARADFVQAARGSGLSTWRVLLFEILPNLTGVVALFFAVLIPQAILAEAALSYLGVGVDSTTPSWGRMIAAGASTFPDAWWLLLAPGLALLATVVSFVLISDAMREEETTTRLEGRRMILR